MLYLISLAILLQDYPSAGQLTHIVATNDIHIVFAVTNDQVPLFQELSHRIPNSILEALTSQNNSGHINIKEIVENKYKVDYLYYSTTVTHTLKYYMKY